MLHDRPKADRILVAQLTREARHRARWRELSGDEEAAAVLAEQNDEWTESRRYMGLEILAARRKTVQLDMGKNDTTEAGLTIEAIPA